MKKDLLSEQTRRTCLERGDGVLLVMRVACFYSAEKTPQGKDQTVGVILCVGVVECFRSVQTCVHLHTYAQKEKNTREGVVR